MNFILYVQTVLEFFQILYLKKINLTGSHEILILQKLYPVKLNEISMQT